ncbi:MAG TPA: hypothetical protein VFT22_05655 [Kofleriaceae bacterium]|nr:hypothetical protein [Kofleriaceae bacterium]
MTTHRHEPRHGGCRGRRNPFGHGSQNLGSRHTHHPVDDARGNAEALLRITQELGLKITLD